MIGIASIIHANAIRVDVTENSTSVSESTNNSNPKAEALTLVIHKFPPKLRPRVIAARNDDVVQLCQSRTKGSLLVAAEGSEEFLCQRVSKD